MNMHRRDFGKSLMLGGLVASVTSALEQAPANPAAVPSLPPHQLFERVDLGGEETALMELPTGLVVPRHLRRPRKIEGDQTVLVPTFPVYAWGESQQDAGETLGRLLDADAGTLLLHAAAPDYVGVGTEFELTERIASRLSRRSVAAVRTTQHRGCLIGVAGRTCIMPVSGEGISHVAGNRPGPCVCWMKLGLVVAENERVAYGRLRYQA